MKIPTGRQETSREAAASLERNGVGNRMSRQIYGYIKQVGGATCDEVEIALEMKHQSVSCLIRYLVINGFLEKTFLRRPTRSGRNAIVWQVTEKEGV